MATGGSEMQQHNAHERRIRVTASSLHIPDRPDDKTTESHVTHLEHRLPAQGQSSGHADNSSSS